MADRYVDIALLKIQRDGRGAVEIEEAASLTINRTKDRKVVNTMNRKRRGKGYRSGTAAFTFELVVPRQISGFEVDWIDMWDRDEVFQMLYEMGDGGRRRTAKDCIINEVNDTFSEDGEATFTISGFALDDKPDDAT